MLFLLKIDKYLKNGSRFFAINRCTDFNVNEGWNLWQRSLRSRALDVFKLRTKHYDEALVPHAVNATQCKKCVERVLLMPRLTIIHNDKSSIDTLNILQYLTSCMLTDADIRRRASAQIIQHWVVSVFNNRKRTITDEWI